MKKITIKDITTIAICSTIILTQEQLLSFIPNVQLTVFFIVLYSKVLGCFKTLIIIFIHTLLDNILFGNLGILFFPFMLIGWSVIPIVITMFRKNNEQPLMLAFVGFVCSLFYSWIFIIPNWLFTEVDIRLYILSDIPWEIVLAVSSFLTILWLYEPCSKVLKKYIKD